MAAVIGDESAGTPLLDGKLPVSVGDQGGDAALPVVSVVIPLYNQERFVVQALESILAQDLDGIEVIVVDDGSTDCGAEAVERFSVRTGLPVHLVGQPNSGGPAAPRNAGIKQARGRFVAFLDPDDYWYPDKLAQQLAVLNRYEDVAMVFADPDVVDESGKIMEPYLGRVDFVTKAGPHLRRVADDVYLSEPSFYAFSSSEIAAPVTSNVVVRRDALLAESVYFPLELKVGEDMDLWFRLMSKHTVAFIDRALSAYRQHGSSLMHQTGKMLAGSIVCHERNFERVGKRLSASQIRKYKARISGLHADVAYLAWLAGDNVAARSSYARAWHWSRNAVLVLGWLKACLPTSVARKARRTAAKAGR